MLIASEKIFLIKFIVSLLFSPEYVLHIEVDQELWFIIVIDEDDNVFPGSNIAIIDKSLIILLKLALYKVVVILFIRK
jgi:hypothetical protein